MLADNWRYEQTAAGSATNLRITHLRFQLSSKDADVLGDKAAAQQELYDLIVAKSTYWHRR